MRKIAVDFTAIFKAQDKVSKTLSGIDKAGNGLDRTFKKLATTAAGVFSAAKIIDFGKQSVNAFADFENGMNEVFTLLPDISNSAMNDMTAQVKAFSKEMGVLPDKTVPALYQAISAGVPKDNVFDFLEVAQKAAIGGVTDLETAVDGISTVVNTYGADVISATEASDLMFSAVKLGKTNFEQLASSLFNVLPSAAAAGSTFDEITAAISVMTSMGTPTSVATTKLRSAIDELAKSGTKTDKVFREISGEGFRQFLEGGGSLQEALLMLEEKSKVADIGINDLFGSIEAGGAALTLTGEGAEKFAVALAEMDNATGATEKAFETMEQSFKRKLDKMNANIDVFKINVGEKLVDAFNWLWDRAGPIIDSIKTGFGEIKDLFSNLGFSGAIEKLFGADVGAIAKVGETYALALFDGVKKIFTGNIQGGFGDILSLLGFNEQSIDGIMDFVDTIKDGIEDLAGFIKPIFDSISSTIETILPTLQSVLNYFTEKLIPVATDVFRFLIDKVISPVVEFWTTNMPKLANIFNNMWIILQPIFNHLYGAFTKILDVVKPIISNVLNLLLGLATSIWSILDGVIQFIAGVFSGDWEKAWGGITKVFTGIGEAIGATFKFLINNAIDALNLLFKGINGIKLPDWVPVLGGKSFNIPEIPKFATGTTNSPDTFIAGEEGPELITGAGGSTVFPSGETDRIISALDRQNLPLMTTANPFDNDSFDSEKTEEKTINIKINGSGVIEGRGIKKEQLYDYLIVNLKPILLRILETEVFEEGDLAYEF